MYCTWLVTWLTVFSRDPTLFMWYHTFGFILRSLGNEPSRDPPHVITSYSHIHVWNVCDFSVRCYFDPWENVLTYKHTYTNMNTSLVCMSVYCLLYKWYTRFDVNIVEKKKKKDPFCRFWCLKGVLQSFSLVFGRAADKWCGRFLIRHRDESSQRNISARVLKMFINPSAACYVTLIIRVMYRTNEHIDRMPNHV